MKGACSTGKRCPLLCARPSEVPARLGDTTAAECEEDLLYKTSCSAALCAPGQTPSHPLGLDGDVPSEGWMQLGQEWGDGEA